MFKHCWRNWRNEIEPGRGYRLDRDGAPLLAAEPHSSLQGWYGFVPLVTYLIEAGLIVYAEGRQLLAC
jgi:hypothetical protein